jgi:hypothetical protein
MICSQLLPRLSNANSPFAVRTKAAGAADASRGVGPRLVVSDGVASVRAVAVTAAEFA